MGAGQRGRRARGLFKASGNFSPRVGLTWRPDAIKDFVVRGGYGIYYNSFTGNRSASSIVGLPYWTWEALSFSALTLQQWETAWPADPQSFIQPSVGESPAWDIDPARTHEWNVSVQKGLPFNSALTVSYVGTRLRDQVSLYPYNEVAPGRYPNLQAAKPYPAFGEINVLENRGNAEYNGLQIKLERRFSRRPLVHRFLLAGQGHLRHGGDRRDRPHPAVRASRLPARALARTTGVTCCGSTRSTSCRSAATSVS